MFGIIRDVSDCSARSEAFLHLCDRYKRIRGAAMQDRLLDDFADMAAPDLDELEGDEAIVAIMKRPCLNRISTTPVLF
jgi:hypothetical protein